MTALPPAIASLLSNASTKFSEDSIRPLEEFARSKEYSLEANLALLKLYQFFPTRANREVIALILVKALTQLPQNDFLLYSYVIPERIVRPLRGRCGGPGVGPRRVG